MKKEDRKTFWDTFESAYQMGEQKHRIFLMDLLKKHHIESLLDVGCGTGPICEINQKYGFTYKGTDYSPAMIEIAKELFPNDTFEVEDARNLTESDNSWDCVLLLHCLDHLDDYASAIKEASRVSKKYVCIVLWRPFIEKGTNLNSVNRMGKEENEPNWEDTHLQEYSKQVLFEAFEQAGLEIVGMTQGDDVNDNPNGSNSLFLLIKK